VWLGKACSLLPSINGVLGLCLWGKSPGPDPMAQLEDQKKES